MNTFRTLITLLLILCTTIGQAQHFPPSTLKTCEGTNAGVQVSPLYSDSLCSSFVICIPKEVRPHLHRTHTEHVVVLEGEGVMQLGDSTFTIAAGHSMVIAPGRVHAVRVTSTIPLRIISVQSPSFDGTDRIMIDR